MDTSQQSPTQLNQDRSYEQYRDDQDPAALMTSPKVQPASPKSCCSDSQDHRTLHDGDTGAVDLHWEPPTQDDDSQFSSKPRVHVDEDDEEPINTLPGPRVSFGRHSVTSMPPPETPAVAHRPFAAFPKGDTGNSVMGASQLFCQTQFTPGVKPTRVSPTSSRPSPYVFNHNTISPVGEASSPLKERGFCTSSPARDFTLSQHFPPTSEKATPYQDNQIRATVPDSPRLPLRRTTKVPEPIENYVSMRSSSADLGATGPLGEGDSTASDDSDLESQERRRVARRIREKAGKVLNSISFPHANSKARNDEVEVPSTSRKHKPLGRSTAEDYVRQYEVPRDSDSDETQETVADSQENVATADVPLNDVPEAIVQEPSTSAVADGASTPAPQNTTTVVSGSASMPPTEPNGSHDSKETIPETSPAGTSDKPQVVELPKSPDGSAVPLPTPPSVPQAMNVDSKMEDSSPASSSISKRSTRPREKSINSSPTVPAVAQTFTQPNSRRSSRLKNAVTPLSASSGAPTLLPPEPGTTTSTLSALSATPNVSSSTTPNTEVGESEQSQGEDRENRETAETKRPSSSPAVARSYRQTKPQALPKIKTYSGASHSRESVKRGSSRQKRDSSVSTDELAGSPSPSSITKGLGRASKSFSRKSMSSRRESSVTSGLFQGMAFAISFQPQQTGEKERVYDDRMKQSKSIENVIIQNGGKIFHDGFSKLFDFGPTSSSPTSPTTTTPSDSLKLKADAQNIGFTALIADGHSRKSKYMQALALGIPCLSWKWISTSVRKNELMDWSTYVLCAGQSKVLGDAIRSRHLPIYDASTARLRDIIEKRPKLLDQTEILLVMKKSNKTDMEQRVPYVFLARLSGATVTRVYTLDEARSKLRDREDLKKPFHWVYVDEKRNSDNEGLFGTIHNDAQAPSKKRKRQSAAASEGRPPKRVRTLTDELVVQSLILGRLVEDEEMDDR